MTQRTMRTNHIVLVFPPADYLPCLLEIVEPVQVKTFIPELPIEAFNETVLHELSGINKHMLYMLLMGDINANAYFSTIVTIDARAGEEVGTITGNDQDNIIYVSGDNYMVYGGAGDDIFYGGAGEWGHGNLCGDDGDDIFMFTETFTGDTTIMDYQVGEDIIAFKDDVSISSSGVFNDNVTLNLSTGGTTEIVGAAGKQITFDLNNDGNKTYQTFTVSA